MSAWPPFISFRSHRETLAAKDETIALLRETIQQLTGSLEAFRETMVALRTPQARTPRAPQEQAKPIDYAGIDPNDNQALINAALAEMGSVGKVSGPALLRRAESLRGQILANRKTAEQKAFSAFAPAAAAPHDIESLIEQTIAEGQAAAGKVM
jgi:hypothetical protein